MSAALTSRLGLVDWRAPFRSSSDSMTSFALGITTPRGTSTSTMFTTPFCSGAASASMESRRSWMGSAWSTNASSMSLRARNDGALNRQ